MSLQGIKPKLDCPDCSVVTVWTVLSHLRGQIVSTLVTVLPFPVLARSYLFLMCVGVNIMFLIIPQVTPSKFDSSFPLTVPVMVIVFIYGMVDDVR